ncbi:MAG: TM2 domain-containing protein [Treponema sp.]|jgi:TM2 domain-containing membrane protein YozV|nr:TM2 domain-containing protein [Treponema sp.]
MYSVGLAYLLWFLSGFGAAGFHRFYLGKIPSGILWMCTGGLLGVGAIYDFLTLRSQVREANYLAAITGAGHPRARGHHPWREVHDGEARVVREEKKESPEKAILRMAKTNRGVITPADLALETDMTMEDAKKNLDALVRKGFAELRVRTSGGLVYVIPEFADSGSPLEDL